MVKLCGLICTICLFFFLFTPPLFFYLFFEVSLVPIFLIIGGWGTHQQRFSAMQYIIFYILVCSVPFFYFLMRFDSVVIGWSETMVSMRSFFLFLGFIVKLPVFVFHS
jgi:NADH:ubiquinone oxidoreductase subunit 4 (subunit M)